MNLIDILIAYECGKVPSLLWERTEWTTFATFFPKKSLHFETFFPGIWPLLTLPTWPRLPLLTLVVLPRPGPRLPRVEGGPLRDVAGEGGGRAAGAGAGGGQRQFAAEGEEKYKQLMMREIKGREGHANYGNIVGRGKRHASFASFLVVFGRAVCEIYDID